MPLTRFEIKHRGPYAGGKSFGRTGAYEQFDGTAHFTVDPLHPANTGIVDLQLAPRGSKGLVEFTADLSIVCPKDATKANGRALVELPNRGRRRTVAMMNRSPGDAPVGPEAHPGDEFLFERGFTVVSIGWQWDVYPSKEMMGLDAPSAMRDGKPIGGETMVEFRPNDRTATKLLADRIHRPLPAAPGSEARARLLVRDWEDGPDTIVPPAQWAFARIENGTRVASLEHITVDGGFEPGRIYQLVYETDRAPVAGLGLIAARDIAPFIRTPSPTNPTAARFKSLMPWGVSQTGRMQRHFLSLGLNRCEDGSTAYDGVHIHVAGARRGAFNHRFAQPSNQTTPLWGHVFPYADAPTTDPLTGRTAGLLDLQSKVGAMPKIISTDSAAEYWRGDATLAHVETSGKSDIAEHPATRRYLFAGAQHTPGAPGQSRVNAGTGTTARYPLCVIDYLPLHRAALINLDRWVVEGVAPPPSQHPRIADGTAVTRDEVLKTFNTIPGFAALTGARLPVVRTVDMGGEEAVGVGRYPANEGATYPALVSAVDADGNERAGIRLPDVTVPVGTHGGWNPRDPETGSPDQIVPMSGLTLWFARDAEARKRTGDPRPSIAERYKDEGDYATKVRAAAMQLVAGRYLLEEDVGTVVEAALVRYRAAMRQG